MSVSVEGNASKRSSAQRDSATVVVADAESKRQRKCPSSEEEKKLEGLSSYLNKNVRLAVMASQHTIFHGGLIPAEAVSKLDFAKDRPAWFSFDAGHSLEYAFKEQGKDGSLTSFKTTRSLVLLDLRWTAYEPLKPSKSGRSRLVDDGGEEEEDNHEEEDREEEEEEEDDDEVTTELLFDRFRDIQGDCCNEFGCGDSDMDLAALIQEVVTARKLGIDGIVSLDYGTFTELILFEPASVLEFHESYDPKTQPKTPGFDYARDSLFGDCFDRICFSAKRPGDNFAHAVLAIKWNAKCASASISEEQREAFTVEYGRRLGMLELDSF